MKFIDNNKIWHLPFKEGCQLAQAFNFLQPISFSNGFCAVCLNKCHEQEHWCEEHYPLNSPWGMTMHDLDLSLPIQSVDDIKVAYIVDQTSRQNSSVKNIGIANLSIAIGYLGAWHGGLINE